MPRAKKSKNEKTGKLAGEKIIKKEEKPTEEVLVETSTEPIVEEHKEELKKEEEKPIPPEFLREFDELDLPPVYSNGKPYKVIDNEYVPLEKAEIIILEKKIAFYQKKLEYLKNK